MQVRNQHPQVLKSPSLPSQRPQRAVETVRNRSGVDGELVLGKSRGDVLKLLLLLVEESRLLDESKSQLGAVRDHSQEEGGQAREERTASLGAASTPIVCLDRVIRRCPGMGEQFLKPWRLEGLVKGRGWLEREEAGMGVDGGNLGALDQIGEDAAPHGCVVGEKGVGDRLVTGQEQQKDESVDAEVEGVGMLRQS